jgi:hypothetical protein
MRASVRSTPRRDAARPGPTRVLTTGGSTPRRPTFQRERAALAALAPRLQCSSPRLQAYSAKEDTSIGPARAKMLWVLSVPHGRRETLHAPALFAVTRRPNVAEPAASPLLPGMFHGQPPHQGYRSLPRRLLTFEAGDGWCGQGEVRAYEDGGARAQPRGAGAVRSAPAQYYYTAHMGGTGRLRRRPPSSVPSLTYAERPARRDQR